MYEPTEKYIPDYMRADMKSLKMLYQTIFDFKIKSMVITSVAE